MLVFGGDEPVGFGLVTGAQRGLLFGEEVFAVIGAPAPAEDPVSVFHRLIHVRSMNHLDPTSLASSD